ncbi:MAG: hypothetical protein ACE5F8_05750, partial [Woeseiaceae bacterium]
MSTAEDLHAQVAATREKLEKLTAAVAHNEAKMQRSLRCELRLLQAEDLLALFDELTSGLRASYGLQSVSVVLSDPDHDIRHLLLAAGAPAEQIEGLLFVESLAGLAPQYVALREPWLGQFEACDHQLVFAEPGRLESIAMIPLAH